MKKSEAFPSKWLKTEDLDGKKWTVTIEHTTRETFKGDDGDEIKTVMFFKETSKGWVLNGVNWDSIEELHGDDSDDWAGKKITIYPTKTSFGKKTVPCIRVMSAQDAALGVGAKRPVKQTENPAEEVMSDDIPF